MRVLVLDDSRERQKVFAQLLAGQELVQVQSYRFAIDALQGDKFNRAYLDYELGDFGLPAPLQPAPKLEEGVVTAIDGYRELTGLDVACYIAMGLPEQKRPDEVIVHSWDSQGAQLMVDILRSHIRKVYYQKFRRPL